MTVSYADRRRPGWAVSLSASSPEKFGVADEFGLLCRAVAVRDGATRLPGEIEEGLRRHA